MKLNLKTGIVTFVTILFSSFFVSGQETSRPAAAPAARPAFRAPARIVSPEILPDNKVTFRVYSKDATKITVSGEWQAGNNAIRNPG